MSQDEITRDVTAVNTIGAQIGDQVNFELPDMIDVFAMFKHIIWPFLFGLIVAFGVRLALRAGVAQLSDSTLIIATILTAIGAFYIALKVLQKFGVVKRDALSYNIEITSVVANNNNKIKT